MFHDTAAPACEPTLPIASRRRPNVAGGFCEPEPLVVVCFVCSRSQDAGGRWSGARPSLEALLSGGVTHGLCPACLERLYPEPNDSAAEAA